MSLPGSEEETNPPRRDNYSPILNARKPCLNFSLSNNLFHNDELVECGIDSLSVTPDSFIAMKRCVVAAAASRTTRFLVHNKPPTLRAMAAPLAQDRISAEVITLPSLDDP